MLSLAQIAHKLKEPPSTIRYHAHNYSEFLPSQKREGIRWPEYEDTAIEILRMIVELTKKGTARNEVKKELKKKYGVIYDGEESGAGGLQQSKGKLAQQANNIVTATTLQQAFWLSKETAELNARFASTLTNQKELLNYKEAEIADLKIKLEAERARAAELQAELLKAKTKTRQAAQIARSKKTQNRRRPKPKQRGMFGWLNKPL